MDFDVFGRNVTDKVDNQKALYYATLSNLCFGTTGQNGKTRKSSTTWVHVYIVVSAFHRNGKCNTNIYFSFKFKPVSYVELYSPRVFILSSLLKHFPFNACFTHLNRIAVKVLSF